MKRAIREHWKDFVAVIGLVVIALGVSYVILQNQRLRIPYLEPEPYVLKAEFSTAQAVIAGQGQTVRVSGVRIGDIGGVELENGRGIIKMDIDPEYKDLIHTNASALLRPKTGLKDMFIDLDPGTADAPLAKKDFTIPISATQPDVNPDEFLETLDRDTRDYLRLLIHGTGRGLEGRGEDLGELLRRFEPTHRDLARINSAVATRRQNLRRLISNLRVLNQELADNDDELAGLVGSSAQVLRAFASEEQNISAAVRELPSTLSTTTDALGRVEAFSRLLGPTAERLRPVARDLDEANRAITPFAKEIAPVLRSDIRPFVRDARPLVREIVAPAKRLAAATPDLTESFVRLNHLFNMLAFNPNGREDPAREDRQEGYLFWIAWVNHLANSLFSSSDAHGTWRPTTVSMPCATVVQILNEEPELEFLQGLTPILTDPRACGNPETMAASKRAAKAGNPTAPPPGKPALKAIPGGNG